MQTTVKLTGMTWDHPRAHTCLVAASKAYEARTGVQIAWHKRSLQAFADEPIETLASTYDLVILDHPHVGQIAQSGCLRALPAMPSEASLGGSVESYVWNDQTWAWPIDGACQMAVQRAETTVPFPHHWDAILNEDAERYRLLTPLLPVDAFDMMLTLIASRGEEGLPLSPGEFCLQHHGVLALKVIKRLFKLGPSEAVGWNPVTVLEALSQNDDFAASPCLFGYINYARPGFRAHQLIYVDLPVFQDTQRRRSILGGAGIGVSARRDHGTIAEDFAAWVTSPEVQGGLYLHNEGQPAHPGAWTANQSEPTYAGFLKGGFETMRTAWTRPRDVWFLHFVDDICDIFPSFFLKDQDEDAFLTDLNRLYRHHSEKKQP